MRVLQGNEHERIRGGEYRCRDLIMEPFTSGVHYGLPFSLHGLQLLNGHISVHQGFEMHSRAAAEIVRGRGREGRKDSKEAADRDRSIRSVSQSVRRKEDGGIHPADVSLILGGEYNGHMALYTANVLANARNKYLEWVNLVGMG